MREPVLIDLKKNAKKRLEGKYPGGKDKIMKDLKGANSVPSLRAIIEQLASEIYGE